MAQISTGFIGAGRIGGAIVRRILQAGFAVAVFDVDAAKMQALAALGARPAASAAEATMGAGVVFLSLPSNEAVAAVCLGPDGVIAHLRPEQLLIDLGTTSYDLTMRLAAATRERGARFVDMPVSGGLEIAAAGNLVTMWGGEPGDLEPTAPQVAAFSPQCHHMGSTGSGQATKQVNNLMNSITLAGSLEGLVLGARAGVDLKVLVRVILASSGASFHLGYRASRLLERRWHDVGHPLTGRRKDVEAALELGRRLQVAMPLGALTYALVLSANRRGLGDLDAAALLQILEGLAGYDPMEAPSAQPAPGLREPAAGNTGLRVGFIGLGRIGRHIAESIRRAGFPLAVHNRSQTVVAEFTQRGAAAASSPAELATSSDVVLTCLPDNAAAEHVYLGPGGLASAARPGAIFVDTGTTSLALTRRIHTELTDRGAHFVDAPVSGGLQSAAAGTLTVMIGASEENFRRVSPVLAAVGKQLFHMGGVGAGQVTKQINNMLNATNFAAMCEGFSLGVASGVPVERLFAVISESSGQSYALNLRGPKVLRRDFTPAYTILGRIKDSQAALELGRELHVPLLLAAATHELFQAAAARGSSDEDWASLAKVYEWLNHVSLSATQP